MTFNFKVIDRILRSNVIRAGIQRRIVNKAAQMLDPQRQSFSTLPEDLHSMFERRPLALYVHFPFCSSACRYCIFKKTLNTSQIDHYVNALLGEIDIYARQPAMTGRQVSSIHLGGGTPSLVPTADIDRVLTRIREHFGFHDQIQITLEGNPESLNPNRTLGYRKAGIDRISIGVQSLDDELLRKIGRTHSRTEAIYAISGLQKAGFTNLNVDLMYGLTGQTITGFLDDVRTVVDLGVPHVSAFPLIERSVREQTARQSRRQSERQRRMYKGLVDLLTAADYVQYSSEDFALYPEAESRYQIDAWRFPKRDVLALGTGSLGSLNGCFYANIPDLGHYFDMISAGRLPVARVTRVPRAEEIRRSVLLGAKYIHVSRSEFIERYGVELEAALEPLLTRFRRLGIWTVDDSGIHVTSEGLQVISAVWSEIILANLADAARLRKSRRAVA